MAALDFREISPAHRGEDRDEFEIFAREFLASEGFRILENPDRGPDGGRDLIVAEDRLGPGGTTAIKWLVSCKHKAHSGGSVTSAEEQNVRDRLGTHRCQGFIAFYSTLPSSGLSDTLKRMKPDYELLQFDSGIIERKLLDSPRGRVLAMRYMPRSYQSWFQASHVVASISSGGDPQHSFSRYFLRQPHIDLNTAVEEASERKLPVFIVIYDPKHPSHSRIDYSLGNFLDYMTTKRLVDQNFVPIVGPSTSPNLRALVPDDDPLENCLWVVLTSKGEVLRREGVYANPDEGLKRVRAVIGELAHRTA